RRGLQVHRSVAFHQCDAQRAQLVAHRRIDVRIRTGYVMPELARQRGDAAHEGAADAEDVDAHGLRRGSDHLAPSIAATSAPPNKSAKPISSNTNTPPANGISSALRRICAEMPA